MQATFLFLYAILSSALLRILFSLPPKAKPSLCRKDRPAKLAAHTKWRNKIKLEVIKFYSKGKMNCACCGEDTPEFLTVDHIANNGTAERKKFTGGGHHNYRYIIKNNFPKGYRIMCFNCNCGRARTADKICPHEKTKQAKNIRHTKKTLGTLPKNNKS